MVYRVQIEPLGDVVPPLTVGKRFCRALDHRMWEEAAALVANLTDEDRKSLISDLRSALRAGGQPIMDEEDPYPDPHWYCCPKIGEPYTRLFLRAVPNLIAWSQACSLRKGLLGINCLFTAVHRQDYETARLIVSLDPKAALRREMGGMVALHHVVRAPKLTEKATFDKMAETAIRIAVLIFHTALGAAKIRSQNNRTPLDCADAVLAIEKNERRKKVYAQILDVLKNPPLKLLALGLIAAREKETPCPLQTFVLNRLFEPRVLRIVLSFLSL